MNCKEHELIPLFLERVLEGQEALKLRAHLPGCVPCNREVWIFKKLRQLLRETLSKTERLSNKDEILSKIEKKLFR